MGKIVCEMCGNTDLVKQDGVYVCQFCGTKYTPEEAKKMMIEGTVDVSGSSVKIDATDKVQKWLAVARQARAQDDFDTAFKYYTMVSEEDLQLRLLHLNQDIKLQHPLLPLIQ